MTRTESFLNGLVKRQIDVLITGDLKHIEIVEAWRFMGITVKEVVREVYLPQVNLKDTPGLVVLADAYLELKDTIKFLKEEF